MNGNTHGNTIENREKHNIFLVPAGFDTKFVKR